MIYNFQDLKKGLNSAHQWLLKEFNGLRTGRATPALLDAVLVELYGSRAPLSSFSSMNVEDARTIRLTPWDQSQIVSIEKAITQDNLGVSVIVDEKGLRVVFPELTSERRTSLIKIAKDKLEESKIRVRQEREKVLKDLHEKEKSGILGRDEMERHKNEMEKIVKEAVGKLEDLFEKKEAEIRM